MHELQITPYTYAGPVAGEKIIAAAVCYDGAIYWLASPARHYQILNALIDLDLDDAVMDLRHQGFLTSANRFVDRYEACRIARTRGQLIRTPTPKDMLTSEDVW